MPGIIEDFGTSKIENKGVLTIGEYAVMTLKNASKQISYVYKEGILLGKYISKKEYTILPSSTVGLFETYTELNNGSWFVACFDEFAKHVSRRRPV